MKTLIMKGAKDSRSELANRDRKKSVPLLRPAYIERWTNELGALLVAGNSA